jgi:CBS domain-containing membrane protein
VLLAAVYNRLTGRRYPFRQAPEIGAHQTGDAAPDRRLGLAPDVLERVLSEFNLGANIGAEDFGRILAAAEAEAARRHFAGLTCGEVMSQDIVSVAPDTSLGTIADLFRKHHFKTLPVVDADRKLEGIISQNDLIQRARSLSLPRDGGFAGNLRALLDPANRRISAQDIMTTDLRVVRPEDGVGILVQLLADGGVQAAPVVEGQRLVGIGQVRCRGRISAFQQQRFWSLAPSVSNGREGTKPARGKLPLIPSIAAQWEQKVWPLPLCLVGLPADAAPFHIKR